ncbi:hypothetical protein PHYPSEUDO_014906 [Phytophthora pseudosyringae]|uniref:Uncharacterized protein n=1 Tax=Phytophthora pseudosyringae TaxID=221518 RepID=A0A8T1V3P7_9STRA|nr:hypothetical protein PHYPSEUDO_014906 [Phytophthora pseudosyringae]
MTKVLGGCYYPTLALAFPLLRRIKKVLGGPAIFAKQAALVGRHEFQADVLSMMHRARDAILDLFKERFSGVNIDLMLSTGCSSHGCLQLLRATVDSRA